jgi:LysR family cys regulon transcriptional activator
MAVTLKQLRYLCEVVREGMNLSRAASGMHTSQPGVSRHMQLLEKELGIEIFERSRNRILGLTSMGKEIVRFAERTVREADNLMVCARELKNEKAGGLVIATNHTHARYTLPRVVESFASRYPDVRLQFVQGSRNEIFRWVDIGEADLAIGTDCDDELEKVVLFPFATFHRIVITPPRHRLLRIAKPALEDLAAFPIITYGSRTGGKWKFRRLFEGRGLNLNIAFSTVDADASKTYVARGLGIAVLPDIAFDPRKDSNLRAIDVRHLFESEVMHVGLNRQRFYRRYAFDFMEMLSSRLTRRNVERVLSV